MGAIQIQDKAQWADCANRCMGQNGIRMTRKRLWIFGWPVPLCNVCVERMVEAYDDTLKRLKEESISA